MLVEGTGTNDNVIAGNYIGLNAAGNAAIANGDSGVQVTNGATDTQIGTNLNAPNPLERNVISGNVNDNGVLLLGAGAGTVVAGNYIGTDATGTFGIGNGPTEQAGGEGVAVVGTSSAGVTIGGTVAGAGNVLSANYIGVLITDSGGAGASDVLVAGNRIGTNATGTAALPNNFIRHPDRRRAPNHSLTGNSIGGTTAAAMNLISGNGGAGIEFDGASTYGNLVEGNFIGTNLAGTAAIANAGAGVLIEAGPGNNLGTALSPITPSVVTFPVPATSSRGTPAMESRLAAQGRRVTSSKVITSEPMSSALRLSPIMPVSRSTAVPAET